MDNKNHRVRGVTLFEATSGSLALARRAVHHQKKAGRVLMADTTNARTFHMQGLPVAVAQ